MATLIAAVAVVGGCTSGASRPTGQRASSSGTPGSTVQATRWWSNSQAKVGSLIAVDNPLAVARTLHVSQSDYCGMLRQTVDAGRSILPGVTAEDPALLASTRAFIAELQAVAPTPVAGPWHTLGAAVITVVAARGQLTGLKGVDAKAVQSAADTISLDAKKRCSVDLSRKAAG